jgi:hypothetical protein
MDPMTNGQRVEVLWHRGEADVWYRGVLLEGGRVQFDEPYPFMHDGPFILQPEEIAALRSAD